MSSLSFVTVSQPCHEDVSNMTPTEHGLHCKACQKEVIDFTSYTREEIEAYRQQHSGSICGSFTEDQLGLQRIGQGMNYMRLLRRFCIAALIAFGSSLFVLPNAAFAQQLEEVREMCGPMEYELIDGHYVFSGELVDEETGEPLHKANVSIPGSRYKTKTDIYGNFVLKVPVNAKKLPNELDLLVELDGYESEILPGPIPQGYRFHKARRRPYRFRIFRRRCTRGRI